MQELIAGVQALTGLANKASDEGIVFNIGYIANKREFTSQYFIPSEACSTVFGYPAPVWKQVQRREDVAKYAKEALEEMCKLLATRDRFIPMRPYDFY